MKTTTTRATTRTMATTNNNNNIIKLFIIMMITNISFINCYKINNNDQDYIINNNMIEEEPISLNSIEQANAAFRCQSDGYFADVAYGCQFYHVCENANNPFDKPSFVKHTFSCVNGTVFNQMSFTCTRLDDSIPCEKSPAYFYLNKRNGDPKAFFLTDDDIFKPSQSPVSSSPYDHYQRQEQPKTSLTPVMITQSTPLPLPTPSTPPSYQQQSTLTTLLFNHESPQSSLPSTALPQSLSSLLTENQIHRTRKPIQSNDDDDDYHDYHHHNHKIEISNDDNHHHRRPKHQQLDRNERRNRLISSMINSDQNLDDHLIKFDDIYRRNYHHQQQQQQHPNDSTTTTAKIHYRRQQQQQQQQIPRAPPYELDHHHHQQQPKTYITNVDNDDGSTTTTTTTTTTSFLNNNKYHPKPKTSTPTSTSYQLDDNINYVPLRTNSPSTISHHSHQDLMKTAYRTSSKSPEPTSKYSQILKNYTPLSSNIETSTNRPLLLDIIDQPQQPQSHQQTPIGIRKTHLPFTPATFSQIYIENQKQSKLESSIPSTYLRLVEQRQQKQQQQQRKPTLKAFNHVNEQLISLTPPPSPLNKSIDHYSTTGSSNHHGSILSPTSSPLTKYEQLIAQSLAKNHNNGRRSKSTKQIAPNHYVTIESPINILDTTQEISRSSSLNGKDSSTGRTILDDDDQQQQQPVKISFVTDNNNNNNNQGNLKNHRLLSSTTIANNNNDNNEQNQQSTSFVDYGTTNYKVVKQIKGKNLLIDPSLENDPERDNIIAQVLEMLSKYN
uniref:Alpha-protein kinase 1-like n=1 Tax=Dermatophagoides pteronyssinus TaxID=6956 RepID=A0A6P6Y4Z6_DERPT|nr:alpha-protein kinase 1-like [Dermatophagoides pteronyssinus]